MVGKGLYYYLWTQARVLAMSTQDWVVDGSGKLHDWRADIADYFMSIQLDSGGWAGNPQTGWREEEPELATMYAILSLQTAYLMAPDPELTLEVTGSDSVVFIDPHGNELVTDATRGLTVTDTTMTSSDPELFRKIWVSASGTPSGEITLTATGTWGEGRTSMAQWSASGDKGNVKFHVATGGFAGPFGIHITVFNDPSRLIVDREAIELFPGKTAVLEIGLEEASSDGPIEGAMLITYLIDRVVADVDTQGVSVAAGGTGVLGLTISVPEDVEPGGERYIVITSATNPPVKLLVTMVEPYPEEAPTTLYWAVIAVLFIMVVVFFLMPKMGAKE